MRFILENIDGKPVVKMTGEKNLNAGNLAALSKAIKSQSNLDTGEWRWLGLCCVMFAVVSLLRWGNQLNQTNILKTLDEFYFSFSNPQTSQAFQGGVNDGIELARQIGQNNNEINAVELFAEKLGQ